MLFLSFMYIINKSYLPKIAKQFSSFLVGILQTFFQN